MSALPIGALAFSLGVILLYPLPIVPPPWLIASAILSLFYVGWTRRTTPPLVVIALCAFLTGMLWAAVIAGSRLDERLPEALEGARVPVEGYVCDAVTPGSFDSLRFGLCVIRWPGQMASGLPSKLRLSWYGGDPQVLAGHRLRLMVVLKRPHGTLNEAGFRYETWLFRHGYRATGSVKSAEAAPGLPCPIVCRYARWHRALTDWATERFGSTRYTALIASLMLGDRRAVTDAQWKVLRQTGTVHLVAISGLHLGLVAIAAGALARWAMLWLAPVGLTEVGRRRGVFAVVAMVCVVYALAAGFTVPTRRALVMVLVAGATWIAARQRPAWHGYGYALAIVLLLDPFAPLDQGFWLSFAAVAVLMWVFAGRWRSAGGLGSLFLAQAGIFLGLWPVLMAFGLGQPLAGAFANLVAIPWVSFVVMPVVILGGLLAAVLPGVADTAGWAMDVVIAPLWRTLEWLAGQEWPILAVSAGVLWPAAATGLLALRLPVAPGRGLVGMLLMAVGLTSMPGAGNVPANPPRNPPVMTPEVLVLDVGQGLSVLVRSGRQVLLYDTGPGVPGVFSAVESTVLPELKTLGVQRIDTLVLSHADRDHSGGLAELLAAVPVGQVITGEPGPIGKRLAGLPHPAIRPCRSQQTHLGALSARYWQWAGAPGTVPEGNDASCVLVLEEPQSRVQWLLPGDLTATGEAAFLRDTPMAVSGRGGRRAWHRVVIAPHHGSNTSSSSAWVKELAPEWVIYSAGYRHRFGHPSPAVADRYRAAGARALNTACTGGLVLSAPAGRLRIARSVDRAPFWIGGKGLARRRCHTP
ncbi:DNA internalization-related competence protein ComEC/Rec2 [Marinobacter sp. C2H3]|uniref:DNA internalization-related competence protein ComEC/Rec2 n=1 Tax=Marinobacter sp. C2H3 TaxID=3119003 RepID=UPI00300E714B